METRGWGRILRAGAGVGDGGSEQGYKVLFLLVLTHNMWSKSCGYYGHFNPLCDVDCHCPPLFN